MFDRIAPVYDVMNRVMTVGLDLRWRRIDGRGGRAAGRPRARRLLRHRRPRVAAAQRGRDGDRARLLAADARARARKVAAVDVGRGRPARAAVRGRLLRGGDGRLRRPQRRRPRRAALAELRRVLAPGGRLGDPRDHAAARPARAVLPALVRPDRAAAREGAEGRRGLLVPAGERAPLPRPGRALRRTAARRPASTTSSTARSPAGSSRCTRGRGDERARRRSARRRASTSTSRSSRSGSSETVRASPGVWSPRSRGTRSRRRQAAAAAARLLLDAARRGAVGRGRRRGRARPHGDARPRRPDRRRGVPPRPRIGLVGLRPGGRAGDRRLPLRARVRRARRDRRRAGGRRCSRTPRSASPAARRCSAARRTTRTRPSTPTSSAAR